MKIPLIAALFFILVYLVLFIKTYGIPKSFSETYTDLKPRQKFIFPVLLWLFAAAIIVANHHILFIVSGACLALVGLARKYWLKSQRTAHIIGAAGSVFAGLTGLGIHYNNWYFLPAFIVVYISLEKVIHKKALIRIKNHTLYTELTGFILLAIGLLM